MKITIVLCEGPHDTAFLSRMLRGDGYGNYCEQIKGYPTCIRGFLTKQLKSSVSGEKKLQESRIVMLMPSYALERNGNLLFLFNLGGDSRRERRKTILNHFIELYSGEPMEKGIQDDQLRIAFVYDADEKSVDERLKEVKEEIKGLLSGVSVSIGQGQWSSVGSIAWGAYIFAGSNRQGRLEDLVLPAMKDTCPEAFGAAEQYLDRRDSYGLPSEMGKGYDRGKSLISIIGQLEKSGCANAAIIEQSHFIDNDKLMAYSTIKEIIRFLN